MEKVQKVQNIKILYLQTVFGPIFVKNPWWAEKIIKEAMKNKGIKLENKIEEAEFEIELKSNESIKEFINAKNNKE